MLDEIHLKAKTDQDIYNCVFKWFWRMIISYVRYQDVIIAICRVITSFLFIQIFTDDSRYHHFLQRFQDNVKCLLLCINVCIIMYKFCEWTLCALILTYDANIFILFFDIVLWCGVIIYYCCYLLQSS